MVRTLVHAAVVALLPLSSIGFGFQILSVDGPAAAFPRTVPRKDTSGEPPPGTIRVDSALVQVPVHVTNAIGANVSSLGRGDFEVWEDNVLQTITHFSMEDAPASVGLVYDCSGSMHGKMRQAAAAAEAFMRTANPEDEFFLVEFGDRPRLTVPFTARPDDILSRIARTRPFGRTALLDALSAAMEHMKKACNRRKALVILSDGGDNQSRRNVRQVKAALIEADLQLYAMGLSAFESSRKLTSEEKRGPWLLGELAEQTGGRMFPVHRAEELPEISQRISSELRSEYVLGYSPLINHDGKYHRITVKASEKDLRVSFRQGYYAPQ